MRPAVGSPEVGTRLRHTLEWPPDAEDFVVVVGVGALGWHVVTLLADSGVRRIHVVDPDRMTESTVRSSLPADPRHIGRLKVDCVADLYPSDGASVQITPWPIFFEVLPDEVVRRSALVLGCVDSVRSRLRIARGCAAGGVPYLDGGLSDWGAAVSLFNPAAGGPCFRCTVSEGELADEAIRFSCADGTAAGPATLSLQSSAAIAAGVLVQEALKLRAASPAALVGGEHLSYSVEKVGFLRSWSTADPECPLSHVPLELEEIDSPSESIDDVIECIKRRLGLSEELVILWPSVWAYCGKCALGQDCCIEVRYDASRSRVVLCETDCCHDDHRVLDDARSLPAWSSTAAAALHGRRLHVRGGDPVVNRQILLRLTPQGAPS